METLCIYTLGGLRIQQGSSPVILPETRKAEALLVYLAYNRRAYSRDYLANLFGDERSQQQAQSNLRVTLTSLRKHVGPYLLIERETVGLNPDMDVWLDVVEMETS